MKIFIKLNLLTLYLIFSFGSEQVVATGLPKENNHFSLDELRSSIQLKEDKSTFLYCTEASTVKGELKLVGGNNMECKGNFELAWDINVPSNGIYELYLIANIRKEGENTDILFKTTGENMNFKLKPTKGPYLGGRNFQRIELESEISLTKGQQMVSFSAKGISGDHILLDFRSIELVPISAKKSIEKENLRALKSRESVDWLVKSGYGLMFHWTSESVQHDGSIKSYEEAVNEFDVKKFADMVEDTGAGYVIFTIGHAESYCPAPIKSWEKVHPGQTTQRDLIAEIADALNKKGVELICYINGPLGFNLDVKKETLTDNEQQSFVNNFQDILKEMGSRYKNQIAGYWFDSWYQIFEKFPEVPFEKFNKATKIGNQNRIICLNSWIYPSVTPWQDYWAGEVGSPIDIPVNGYMQNGPAPELPYQALLIMEPYWVQQKSEMPNPRLSSQKLSKYILDCMDNGGAVTVNLGIYQDGTVGKKALDVMKEVKSIVRK
ncbi:alpha-L-fucosidase [Arenibacter sp. F20364]|uniref:alpha-L-fucosidase n=1 Tax=Arenibacter sp. F20364 TaxID=2926415 RepID=UPI001FF6F3A5|nr:alpha-L-fucosidase [Arenibacter sp. F20364]MCK0191716.1 alpha-L-fucosidase [Arenibacter sp. F20364]